MSDVVSFVLRESEAVVVRDGQVKTAGVVTTFMVVEEEVIVAGRKTNNVIRLKCKSNNR